MADAQVKAAISGREALTVSVIIGDGVAGYWNIALHEDGRVLRRWEGRSDDALPDAVFFPAGSLNPDRHVITWSAVVYGPARRSSYRVEVQAEEGGRSVLSAPVRLHGEVEARKTATLSGSIDVEGGA